MFKKYDYYINQLLDTKYGVDKNYNPKLFINSNDITIQQRQLNLIKN